VFYPQIRCYQRNGAEKRLHDFWGSSTKRKPVWVRYTLGWFSTWILDEPETSHPGEELFRFCWATRQEQDKLNLEYWSFLALQLVVK
jgi:hypothetical protein